MRGPIRIAEVEAVDRFLAEEKHLNGAPPEFGPSTFNRRDRYERTAKWPIAGPDGIVGSGQIRFVARPGRQHSVSLIFKGQGIWRLDLVDPTECKANPHWARSHNLPAIICGPHVHAWEHNRDHVSGQKTWELSCREPLPPRIRRFDQAWPWLAERINLVLTSDQREFELPDELV
jgi:hypothetical protein